MDEIRRMFEQAEEVIVKALAQHPSARKFALYNPWFMQLPVNKRADLMIKYPQYAEIIERESCLKGEPLQRRINFWYKMHKVFYIS